MHNLSSMTKQESTRESYNCFLHCYKKLGIWIYTGRSEKQKHLVRQREAPSSKLALALSLIYLLLQKGTAIFVITTIYQELYSFISSEKNQPNRKKQQASSVVPAAWMPGLANHCLPKIAWDSSSSSGKIICSYYRLESSKFYASQIVQSHRDLQCHSDHSCWLPINHPDMLVPFLLFGGRTKKYSAVQQLWYLCRSWCTGKQKPVRNRSKASGSITGSLTMD